MKAFNAKVNCYNHFVGVAEGHSEESSTLMETYLGDKSLGTRRDRLMKSSRRRKTISEETDDHATPEIVSVELDTPKTHQGGNEVQEYDHSFLPGERILFNHAEATATSKGKSRKSNRQLVNNEQAMLFSAEDGVQKSRAYPLHQERCHSSSDSKSSNSEKCRSPANADSKRISTPSEFNKKMNTNLKERKKELEEGRVSYFKKLGVLDIIDGKIVSALVENPDASDMTVPEKDTRQDPEYKEETPEQEISKETTQLFSANSVQKSRAHPLHQERCHTSRDSKSKDGSSSKRCRSKKQTDSKKILTPREFNKNMDSLLKERMEKLKNERLSNLIRLGILDLVDEKIVSALQAVKEPNADRKLCSDPKDMADIEEDNDERQLLSVTKCTSAPTSTSAKVIRLTSKAMRFVPKDMASTTCKEIGTASEGKKSVSKEIALGNNSTSNNLKSACRAKQSASKEMESTFKGIRSTSREIKSVPNEIALGSSNNTQPASKGVWSASKETGSTQKEMQSVFKAIGPKEFKSAMRSAPKEKGSTSKIKSASKAVMYAPKDNSNKAKFASISRMSSSEKIRSTSRSTTSKGKRSSRESTSRSTSKATSRSTSKAMINEIRSVSKAEKKDTRSASNKIKSASKAVRSAPKYKITSASKPSAENINEIWIVPQTKKSAPTSISASKRMINEIRSVSKARQSAPRETRSISKSASMEAVKSVPKEIRSREIRSATKELRSPSKKEEIQSSFKELRSTYNNLSTSKENYNGGSEDVSNKVKGSASKKENSPASEENNIISEGNMLDPREENNSRPVSKLRNRSPSDSKKENRSHTDSKLENGSSSDPKEDVSNEIRLTENNSEDFPTVEEENNIKDPTDMQWKEQHITIGINLPNHDDVTTIMTNQDDGGTEIIHNKIRGQKFEQETNRDSASVSDRDVATPCDCPYSINELSRRFSDAENMTQITCASSSQQVQDDYLNTQEASLDEIQVEILNNKVLM